MQNNTPNNTQINTNMNTKTNNTQNSINTNAITAQISAAGVTTASVQPISATAAHSLPFGIANSYLRSTWI